MRHRPALLAIFLAACGSAGGGGGYYFGGVDGGDGGTGATVDLARPGADLSGAPDLLVPSPDLTEPDLRQDPRCDDGLRNGGETDVDCGGVTCPRCVDGRSCAGNGDCVSGSCQGGRCVAQATCNDGVANGAETDVDCGGNACPRCGDNDGCNVGADCQSGTCKFNRCVPAATCNDGVKNGAETDVDCGGGACGACALGKRCALDRDCASGLCSLGLCAGGGGQSYGPKHTFAGLTSDHYVTQGLCSVNGAQNDAVDAAYFCTHFYSPNCAAQVGYLRAQLSSPTAPKMHKNGGCTAQGSDVPGKTCDGGPCKIGNWNETTTGLTNLVCVCP